MTIVQPDALRASVVPAEAALELRGVAKLYGRTAALRALSLTLSAGETMALLGPNGSGKTTLLKIIAGAITPTLGSGRVLGYDLRTQRHLLRSRVGLLAGESYLYDDLTASENLRFILTMAGRRPVCEEIDHSLVQVGLKAQTSARVRTFSSGMKRRLSLARLLILNPTLLLLDEPYNSLDVAATALVDELVGRWSMDGKTTVLATHDAERALALANVVAVLEGGTLTYLGPVGGYRMHSAQHVG